MRFVVRLINSIENLDPRMFAGQILVTPDGGIYTAKNGDELGGIGDFFKKIGAIALPLAGTIAAPFTGGLSLALIGAGGAIGGGLLGSSLSSSGGGTQAKGLAAIQAKGQEVISAFDTLKQKITSDVNFTKADAYAAADKLTAILSDASQFYQAKKGKDAEALAGFKTQAAQLAAQMKSLADAADSAKQQNSTALQTTTGAGGQTITKTVDRNGNIVQSVSGSANNLPFGLSTTEILIGAAAFYFLFIRS